MSWTVDFEDLRLKTSWREYCDIPITEPTGEGFGTIMLSSMPNAEVTNIWHPNGLECQMSVPIEIALEEFAPTEEIPVRPV